MTVFFHTLGCKVNRYETEAMRRAVEQAGFSSASYEVGMTDVGDGVVVINSCTVTGESDRKLRQLVRRVRRDHPRAVIVLTGCMPQAFPEEAASTEADIVLGNASRAVLPQEIARFLRERTRRVAVTPHSRAYEPLCIDTFSERTRAFVKIEDGCDRFCSYCIIPYARGRVRSRRVADLRDEVTALAAQGYREIVLVGINLTAFGKDTGESLCDAVDAVCAVPSVARVRLGSLEPDHITAEMLARWAAQPKFCPQFHLSLQSGCDATLRRMNRHYTAAEYAALCADIRNAFPNAALTTDVMVGFPDESDEEFAQSLAFVESIGFAKLHVFAYSRRAGTPAAAAKGQLSRAVKAARSRRMIDVGEASAQRYHAQMVGTVTTVLTETRQPDDTTEGYTPTYVPVRLNGAYESGQLLTVRITEAYATHCVAVVEEAR